MQVDRICLPIFQPEIEQNSTQIYCVKVAVNFFAPRATLFLSTRENPRCYNTSPPRNTAKGLLKEKEANNYCNGGSNIQDCGEENEKRGE